MIVSTGAFFIDMFLGDPNASWHPVIMLGKLIKWLDNLFYRENGSNREKLVAGAVVVLLVLTVAYCVTDGILWLVGLLGNKYLSFAAAALLLKMTISPKTLAKAGKEIYEYLVQDDLATARKKVGWIVGRDTDKLSVGEVTRATVETVSENITDGIISPLFYFALGGVPLAMLYRAANTMDSMLGYKNERYLYFGRVAARLDDLLNFIPARITGLLIVAASGILGYDYRCAWQMLCRDADKHPSPNGGYCEAAVAGALNIRLGGLNYYFGEPHFRAYMGDAVRELAPRHIIDAVKIMYTVTIIFLGILVCL